MGFFDDIYDNRNFIGKILFIISLLVLVYLFIIPVNHLVIHIDEHFTIGLTQIPWNSLIKSVLSDVQPLYYLIVFGGLKAFSMANITVDVTFACKMLSLLSYILLMILSLTKIRRQYGMLTSGVFMFALATMSSCMIEFITIRMYGWAIFFLVTAFLYYCDVIEKSNVKSWILFTLFSILSMYTHYFLVLPVLLMYLSYIVYILLRKTLNRRREFIKFLASFVVAGLVYAPSLYALVTGTVTMGLNEFTQTFSGQRLLNYYTFFVIKETSSLYSQLYLKILVAVFFLFLIIVFLRECRKYNVADSFRVFAGINVYLWTILIGVAVLTFTLRPFNGRYLLPVIAVFWFIISLIIGRMKSKSLLFISLIFLVVFGTLGFMTTNDFFAIHDSQANEEKQLLDSIDNGDNIVAYDSAFYYTCYHYMLDESIEYAYSDLQLPYESDYIVESNLTWILEDNTNKTVYLWQDVGENQEVSLPDNIGYEKVGGRGDLWLLKLRLADNNTSNQTVV